MSGNALARHELSRWAPAAQQGATRDRDGGRHGDPGRADRPFGRADRPVRPRQRDGPGTAGGTASSGSRRSSTTPARRRSPTRRRRSPPSRGGSNTCTSGSRADGSGPSMSGTRSRSRWSAPLRPPPWPSSGSGQWWTAGARERVQPRIHPPHGRDRAPPCPVADRLSCFGRASPREAGFDAVEQEVEAHPEGVVGVQVGGVAHHRGQRGESAGGEGSLQVGPE